LNALCDEIGVTSLPQDRREPLRNWRWKGSSISDPIRVVLGARKWHRPGELDRLSISCAGLVDVASGEANTGGLGAAWEMGGGLFVGATIHTAVKATERAMDPKTLATSSRLRRRVRADWVDGSVVIGGESRRSHSVRIWRDSHQSRSAPIAAGQHREAILALANWAPALAPYRPTTNTTAATTKTHNFLRLLCTDAASYHLCKMARFVKLRHIRYILQRR
jgi:hypothetical protein